MQVGNEPLDTIGEDGDILALLFFVEGRSNAVKALFILRHGFHRHEPGIVG